MGQGVAPESVATTSESMTSSEEWAECWGRRWRLLRTVFGMMPRAVVLDTEKGPANRQGAFKVKAERIPALRGCDKTAFSQEHGVAPSLQSKRPLAAGYPTPPDRSRSASDADPVVDGSAL